jgi:Tfp pilus assembly protein PilO
MTMPDERARALRFASEFLQDLMTNPDVPASVKQEALATLRHYPSVREIKNMVRDVHHLTLSSPRPTMHWLAPEEDGLRK